MFLRSASGDTPCYCFLWRIHFKLYLFGINRWARGLCVIKFDLNLALRIFFLRLKKDNVMSWSNTRFLNKLCTWFIRRFSDFGGFFACLLGACWLLSLRIVKNIFRKHKVTASRDFWLRLALFQLVEKFAKKNLPLQAINCVNDTGYQHWQQYQIV